ncbi:MAG TPA: hypothetical protein VN915_15525 [Elusimicrobiota bacterium]|nr:hypothetical protein [Elusimicrobiota bacterium]
MRPPLWRLGALLLLSAVSAGAAFVDPVSLAPTLGLAQNVPAFRASMLAQVSLAGSLSSQMTPTLTPLLSAAAAAPTAADPWRAESAKLVGALVAEPAAVAHFAPELRAAIGDQGVDQLQKAASRLQAKAAATPELGSQLRNLRSGLNLEDPAAVSELGSRLNALFENSKSRPETPAPAVAADENSQKKPLVSLVHRGETPVMSPAELETYLAGSYKNNDGDTVGRTIVTPRGMKKAIFASGDYKPQYDAELKRLGYDQVIIKTPTRAELKAYTEEDGYHLKSEYERWVMTTRTLDEHKAALGKAQRIRQFENQLAASDKIQTKLVPLTVEDFEKWYPVYEDEVVGKPGGKRNIARDYARKLAEKGKLDGWYGLWYYDPADPAKIVGGVISKAWPERGMFVMGYAAYRPELKDVSPSVRTFKETMALAKSLGYKVLSFGQDTNFFGYDYSLGLMSNKAGFLLTPYPEDEIVLMKMLDASKIAEVKNKAGQTGGYMFFGIKRDSPVVERYLESKEAGKPKEAQDLLGSSHYFDDKIVPAKETTVVWHYKGDDPNPLRVPVGIDVIDRQMK